MVFIRCLSQEIETMPTDEFDQQIQESGVAERVAEEIVTHLELPGISDGQISSEMEERCVASNSVVQEILPFPVVHYPDTFGVFFGFSESQTSQPCLCLCLKRAIQNLIGFKEELALNNPIIYLSDPFYGSGRVVRRGDQGKFDLNGPDKLTRTLDVQFFPKQVAASLDSGNKLLQCLNFVPDICHRCNKAVPSMEYVDRDSTRFQKSFGWYVNSEYLSLGIFPHELGIMTGHFSFFAFLSEAPLAGFEKLRQDQLESQKAYIAIHQELVSRSKVEGIMPSGPVYDDFCRLRSESNRAAQKINKKVENQVREALGFKKIGDAWISETLRYQIIQKVFFDKEIQRHHRPGWLEGLELDIFVPEIDLGIEYQGEQHFKAVKFFGGKPAFRALQHRDARKVQLCKQFGVRLIHVNYDEPLTEQHIRAKLGNIGSL